MTQFGVSPRTTGPLGRKHGWKGGEAVRPKPPRPVVYIDAIPRAEIALHGPVEAAGGPTIAELIEATARLTGVSPEMMRGARRWRDVAMARQIAMWLCRRFTGRSFSEIGRAFGNRDHTTALHAARKIDGLIDRHGIDGGDDPAEWAKRILEAT